MFGGRGRGSGQRPVQLFLSPRDAGVCDRGGLASDQWRRRLRSIKIERMKIAE